MTEPIQTDDIRSRIKRIVSTVSNIPEREIGHHASFREDLGLDSLSLLEIGVDVDYEFRLGLPDLDERLQGIRTLDEAVELVHGLLAEDEDATEDDA